MKLTFITPSSAIPCPRMIRRFDGADAASAQLTMTGLGLYRAYLNGKRVGQDWFTPGFNDYDAYLRYQVYDVSDCLQPGENVLEVYLGKGPYMGRFGLGPNGENRWGTDYVLAARLELTGADGAVRTIETDESWTASASFLQDGNLYDGEVRDDTAETAAEVPCVRVEKNYELVAQFSPTMQVVEERKPVLIVTPKGEQVLDFGQNFAGVFRFINRAPKGAKIYIQTGEVLQEGCFYRDNLRSAKSEYTYISDGCEKEIEPYFTFYGFRYMKVEGMEEVHPADFTGLVICSALRETLKVSTDNEKLNQLMRNALWGQRGNFLDVPTDCPQRDERLGWTADTQVFVNTACYQMDCKDFYLKFLRDMRADQTMYFEGNLPMYSPSLKKACGNGGAVWADAGTIVPWNLYMNYGDKAILEQYYPMMRDYVEVLMKDDRRLGFTHVKFDAFTFGDWLARDGLTPQSRKGGTSEPYIQSIYYWYSTDLTAKTAALLGLQEDAQRYAALAGDIRAAVLDEFFSPAGHLCVDTQTAYVLALYFGMWRDRDVLVQDFLYRLRRDIYQIKTGFTGTPFLLPVLFDNGLEDLAYHMLLSETYPSWLACVNLGATTIWERWNSLDEEGRITGTDMNSLNHYAYGSVCEAIYSRIMGLRSAAPGWTKAVIQPHINGRLRQASIAFDSPAGEWKVDWAVEADNRIRLRASVPQGASAQIVLPHHPEDAVHAVEGGAYEYVWTATQPLDQPKRYPANVEELIAEENADIRKKAEADAAARKKRQ